MNAKNIILAAALFGIAASAVFGLSSCAKSGQHEKDPDTAYYTCPMHHQIHMDHPGQCPICGMDLVRVDPKKGGGGPQSGITIPGDQQQLIGLRTEAAVKKRAVQEIRTVGRVAFDPDLAVAQREYLEIVKSVPALKDAARSNLRLKGMSEEEIRGLERKGASTNLYLPQTGDSVWVYATLYQDEANLVTPGLEAEVSLPSGPDEKFIGTIRAIDPVVNPITRSARARIEIPAGGGRLRPDTYVDVSLKVDLGEAILIPKSAVIDTGVRKVAFVVRDGTNFQPRDIKTGPEAGDNVVVNEGIAEGEKVVASAAFMVDSESQLKAAVASAPGCPEGQSWDQGMSMCMPTPGK
ncbi:MAG TPA: efflux RND transporter periplasmic adaptor subunit [bacterium]|nr:efflux RND transporter periplasmic adaptor subunit [bacterium]